MGQIRLPLEELDLLVHQSLTPFSTPGSLLSDTTMGLLGVPKGEDFEGGPQVGEYPSSGLLGLLGGIRREGDPSTDYGQEPVAPRHLRSSFRQLFFFFFFFRVRTTEYRH